MGSSPGPCGATGSGEAVRSRYARAMGENEEVVKPDLTPKQKRVLNWVRVGLAILIVGVLVYLITVYKFTLHVADMADEKHASAALYHAADRLVTYATAVVIAFASAFAAVLPAAVLGLKRRDAFGGVLAGSAALVSTVDTGNRATQESLTYVTVTLLGLSVAVVVWGAVLERWKLKIALQAEEATPDGEEARGVRDRANTAFDALVKKTFLPIPLAIRYLGIPTLLAVVALLCLVFGPGWLY